ncbi:beta-ketoacyl-ACP synthase III [Marinicella rhabdoformis]|uniref:beta-ketoacyl-ACP synthase III n=1 Tax=Marinicella rhabdoformis TaxID=2580566 RepID=UPI0012AEBC1C|nr:beta-ketoacyl-ACP synthase III [Marinicella rhabdoformis]
MTIYSKIIGTGSHLPDKILTNADLEKMVDTDDQWIQDRTGIKQRHVAGDGETTSTLAIEAAKKAFEVAGITAKDIDLIVVGTTTPDLIFPSTACLIQNALDCPGIAAFDVNAACSGSIYALAVADKFIKSGTHKRALVIGAETLTRMVDWNDRTTCVLFGDGASAIVLEATEEKEGVLSTHIHANGAHGDLLNATVGVSSGLKNEPNGGLKIRMKGNEVFKTAVMTLGRIVKETLKANDMKKTDIDWLIPHQANLRIITATAKKLSMSMDQVIVTVDKHGNTSAASVGLALDEAIKSGKVKRGDVLLLEAFGGGFTWGSALIQY